MSINLYLNEEELPNASGFSEKDNSDGSKSLEIKGVKLFTDKGRIYAMWGECDHLPSFLEPLVTDVSFYEHIVCERISRELGIYRHESAEAEVSLQQSSKHMNYLLKIKATKLADAHELLQKFKVGSIRPEESYEGRQQGLSRADLEAELREAQRKIGDLQRFIDECKRHLEQVVNDLTLVRERVRNAYKLSATLSNPRWQWPWCSKRAIATRINLALNGK